MRLILNDRVLFRPLTGVGHYARQLLAALQDEAADVEVHAFLYQIFGPPRRRDERDDPTPATPPRPPRMRTIRDSWWLRRVIQGAYRTAFRLGARGFPLYHEPNHIPIRCGVPTVTTIHDLSALVHPDWHPADRIRWYEREFAAGLRQTRRFIAASRFTKEDMVRRLGLSPDVIDITYQAPRPAFRPQDPATARGICDRLELPERFFLFVGTLEPRKNVAGLLEAFAALPRETRQRVPLVLAGAWGWRMQALPELLAEHDVEGQTRLLGYLTDSTLAALYSTCTALIWPTLYEGFGLPPLEAMACGCPVIVSNVTSLPEVVGQAGVLLDPHEPMQWAEAMEQMAEDDAWREQWKRRGLEQAASFSWKRCARETIACYQAALQMA